jgi:hypothetical protein
MGLNAGSSFNNLSSPTAITIDYLNNVYVADLNFGRIQKYNSTGALIEKWSISVSNISFPSSGGISSESKGNIYVANSDLDKIQRFTPSGDFPGWDEQRSDLDGVNIPRDIAIDPFDSIYVIHSGNIIIQNTNNTIQKYNSNGTLIPSWSIQGLEPGEFASTFTVNPNKRL